MTNSTYRKKTMKAFHGDQKLKDDLLAEVEKHRVADQIIGGTYGKENGSGKWQGCAVGCSIRSYNLLKGKNVSTSDHSSYPELFGIPQMKSFQKQ